MGEQVLGLSSQPIIMICSSLPAIFSENKPFNCGDKDYGCVLQWSCSSETVPQTNRRLKLPLLLYRKKPYVARWYEGTRQRNRFFSTESARETFIQRFEQSSRRADPVLPDLPPHQLMRWQQATQIAPEADPVEVYKFWKEQQRKIAKLGDRHLIDASTAYIRSMENIGRNPDYIQHVRRALADLHDRFGNRLVREFTTEELREYLFALSYGAITIKNKRTYFHRNPDKTALIISPCLAVALAYRVACAFIERMTEGGFISGCFAKVEPRPELPLPPLPRHRHQGRRREIF